MKPSDQLLLHTFNRDSAPKHYVRSTRRGWILVGLLLVLGIVML